jgi:hypothetical protein
VSDLEWLRAKERERKARVAEALRAAREEAERRGKEPFDFARLRALYDPSSELAASTQLPDPSALAEDLEQRYYLDSPDVLTLEEFARRLGRERPFR